MKLKTQIDNIKISVMFSVAILFILSWAPYMENHPLATSGQRRVLNYLVLFCGVGIILVCPKRRKFSYFEITAAIAILVYRAINIFYAYDYKGIGITSIFIGLLFCYVSNDIRTYIFKYFNYIMVIVSFIGIICYISYFIPIGIPYDVISGSGRAYKIIDFKVCYCAYDYNAMLRFCGLFEEPGWFGTWAAFYLCADGLNLKKKENIIILVAGILTFSLAFIMLLVIYYFLINLSNWKRWLWLVVIIIVYLFVLPNIQTGNSSIDHVLHRMVITSEGLEGDNRYGQLFESLYESTIHSSKIYFGYGAGYAEIYGTGNGQGLASIKSYIVNFGIFGTIVIFFPILIVFIKEAVRLKNRRMLFYILITIASLYQRPYLFWTPYFIIFICGVSYTWSIEKDRCDSR